MRDSAIASPHTITAITVKRVIASINLNGVTQFDGIAHCGKEQTMNDDLIKRQAAITVMTTALSEAGEYVRNCDSCPYNGRDLED